MLRNAPMAAAARPANTPSPKWPMAGSRCWLPLLCALLTLHSTWWLCVRKGARSLDRCPAKAAHRTPPSCHYTSSCALARQLRAAALSPRWSSAADKISGWGTRPAGWGGWGEEESAVIGRGVATPTIGAYRGLEGARGDCRWCELRAMVADAASCPLPAAASAVTANAIYK